MSETINKNKYLDLEGLKKYDELIKGYIDVGNESLSRDVSSLKIDVDALKGIDHNAYIKADLELENSLKGYVDDKMNYKQDAISDLETIRSGAAAGATALQEVPDGYVTETELTGKGYLTADDFGFATNDDIDALFGIQ